MNHRELNDQEIFRRKKLQELTEIGKNPYSTNKVLDKTDIVHIVEKYKNTPEEDKKNESISDTQYTCCGRIMLLREPFFIISEEHHRLQCYLNIKKSDPELVKYFQNYVDIGDVIQVEGCVFFSMKGELSLKISNLKIISKCLKPLPEKTSGIKDKELLVRERVATLITDKDLFESLALRSKILFNLRLYLQNLNYLEVETSVLQKIPGGGIAKPFITRHNELNEDLYLRIAPELPLKKLITAGYNKVFEIGKSFRNEGIDSTHNPEFTSIEIYTAFFGMEETMNLTENIIKHLANSVNKNHLNWLGHEIDLTQKFKVVYICDLVRESTGVDFYKNKVSREDAIKLADKYHIKLLEHEKTTGHILHKLFEKLIEDTLSAPTFVCGYHKDVSPLSKHDPNNEEFTNRFELFIGGKELANGFEELNDPIDQLHRFEKQAEEKKSGNSEAMGIDYEYIRDIEYGLPPTGGLGIGIDRLIMLFNEKTTIKNVLFFPHNKTE